jgi:5'-3' exonuclease
LNRRPPKSGKRKIFTNTLLVDGNALFKVGFHGASDVYNSRKEKIGGIYQFITVLRKLLSEDLYHKCYVVWDGKQSGLYRYQFYPEYKKKRGKNFENDPDFVEEHDEGFLLQKFKVEEYLEELPIRQVKYPFIEGDDLVGHYCLNKAENERITIVSNDRDMCQLINPEVKMYLCGRTDKKYVQYHDFMEHFPYLCENAMLMKMLTGDSSDDITGVKGLGEKTLLEHFPELAINICSIEDIIARAKEIQEERKGRKLKPLKVLTNIIEGITTGSQEKLYEINERLVNLKKPLLNEKSIEEFNAVIEYGITLEGRAIKNVYEKMKRDEVDKLMRQPYLDYFMPFKKLNEREKKQITNITE